MLPDLVMTNYTNLVTFPQLPRPKLQITNSAGLYKL